MGPGNLYFLKALQGILRRGQGGEPLLQSTRGTKFAPNLLWGLGQPTHLLWASVAKAENLNAAELLEPLV